MNRNVDDHFAKTPTPHFPRSRFDMGIHKRLQTQGHGRLYPFFCRMVYPGDTWKMDLSTFVRMDTSLRVPLDDIYLDTYFFFVPFRIIDDNFKKVLGEKEPYDDDEYSIPQVSILPVTTKNEYAATIDNILSYLGYSQAQVTISGGNYDFSYDDEICAYPWAAYLKIWNDWFRDQNVDASIPYEDLYGADYNDIDAGSLLANAGTEVLKVNRYHDYFSSALISPQKGPAQTIPLGTSAPVGMVGKTGLSGDYNNVTGFMASSVADLDSDNFNQLTFYNTTDGQSDVGIITDLSKAAGTINELRLAFAIQALYERRGRFGTRYIETIRGQWGIEVPDSFFMRPEYLGGSRVTLNNVPVLSTENSSQLGQMAGNSATLSGGSSWTKTFIEFGLIFGVSCTRIKHSYTQGKRKELFGLKTDLDLYNPVFANIGMQPIELNEIYNQGTVNTDVFAYQEAWADLRSDVDTFAGLFGMFSSNTELKNKWHYGDYYASAPSFSAAWLKEDPSNVARTLTGQLINGASTGLNHQFMFGYYYHPVVTRILPSHSIPVELIGRL